ncbi:MAG: hypothetical protein WCE54_12225 [Ignavibacteriaceae bacterium]
MNKNFLNILLLLFVINIALPKKPEFPGNQIKQNNKSKLFKTNEPYLINHITINDSSEKKGDKIIADYVSAIGGKNNLRSLMDRTTFITGKVRNMNIHVVVYQKVPDKYYQKIELGATEQKIIYDGVKGFMITGDDIQEMQGQALEKLKYEATMQLLIYLNAYDVKAEFTGIEKANGVNAYKVILNFPGDMKWTEYYDTTTYLRVKEEKPVNSPSGKTSIQESFFSDYKDVNGIKYPFNIKQFLGTSKFEFYVDSIKVNTGLSDRNFEIE